MHEKIANVEHFFTGKMSAVKSNIEGENQRRIEKSKL